MKFTHRIGLLSATALAAVSAAPAFAQDADKEGSNNDIVVTAQRVEQRLQDVPISITVLSQQNLENNNVASAKDLAAITPGLQVQNRYGGDTTNFSIRGFTQEQRTYSTVGTYFADVVAPRGSGASFGGDGAGPGSLFDLQNVQVLKGPQGTLQGRNSTGGAVLLVPKKPTDRFEGYVEGGYGDYNMRRGQVVLNIPLADTFRVRLGVDHMKRDGYLQNAGRLGDGVTGQHGLANINYTAARLSVVGDLTPNLENYLVASYTHSRNNAIIPKVIIAYPGVNASGLPFGNLARDEIAREAGMSPWTVANRLRNSESMMDQWQVTNATTWTATDSLTIKNILSYGEFRGRTNQDLYGTYFVQPAVAGTETSGNQVTGFAFTAANPFNGHTNAQSTFIEELQFQGHPGDGKFVWQAGLYAEISNPLGKSGVQTATFTACENVATLNCVAGAGFSYGLPNLSLSASKFRDYAVYGQASYNLTEQLKLTAGMRYTWDKQDAVIQMQAMSLKNTTTCINPTAPDGGKTFAASDAYSACAQNMAKSTSAPTWLLDLDYKPIENVMLYAKWSRGYRAGGIALFSPDPIQRFEAERVDTYELGAKTSWDGGLPGTFNISGYYNNFRNQQLLLGVSCNSAKAPFKTCQPNAAIVNAGKSRLYGFEADLTLRPFAGLQLAASYAYLNSKLQKFVAPTFPSDSAFNEVTPPIVGGPIPNSQPHKVNVSANYALPLDNSVGKVTLGGTYIYTAKYRSVNAADPVNHPENGMIPSSGVINLNVSWENLAGMPIDASFFMSNVTNKVTYLQVNDSTTRGFVTALLGEPRMWGFRLKYRFGN